MCIRVLLIFVFAPLLLQAETFKELRDGRLFIRVTDEVQIRIAYKAVYLAGTHRDDVYVQAPDGTLTTQLTLLPGDLDGTRDVLLDNGPGDYCIAFAAQNFRSFTVDVPETCPAVFSPTPFYMSMHVSDTLAWYFYVPEATSRLSVGARRDHNSTMEAMDIRGPDGSLRARLQLPSSVIDAYNPYDSLVVSAPQSGFWSISFPNPAAVSKVSFWVQGVPNIFVRDSADFFLPVCASGVSSITGNVSLQNNRLLPCGMLGATVGGTTDSRLLDLIEDMGLQSCNYYLGHKYREPVNDNGDPFLLNPTGFNWGDDARIHAYTTDPLQLELMHIISAADWLGEPLLTTEQHEEMGEFIEAYLLHHNVDNNRRLRYFSLQDEPNQPGRSYTREAYLQLVRTVGERLAAHADPRVRNARILVSGSSNFLESNTSDPSEAGAAWAEEAYARYDTLVGGISMHVWDRRSVLDVRCFAEEIAEAKRIMTLHDQDGDSDEAIVIDQTCVSSGSSISPFVANGFDAALWWGAVGTTCLNTGAVTAVNWFTTIDDPHHRKGLARLENEVLVVKPVGQAMRFLNRHLRDSVLTVRSSHPELHALATVDSAHGRLTLLAVNTGNRGISIEVLIQTPPSMSGPFDVEQYFLRDGATFETMEHREMRTGPLFTLSAFVPPRCLSALELVRQPVTVRQHISPETIQLGRPYPNPFRSSVVLPVAVAAAATLRVEVLDVLGRIQRVTYLGRANPGVLTLRWDGSRKDGTRCAPGLYYLRLRSEEGTQLRSVVLQ